MPLLPVVESKSGTGLEIRDSFRLGIFWVVNSHFSQLSWANWWTLEVGQRDFCVYIVLLPSDWL